MHSGEDTVIAIVDYGMGNVGAIHNMFRRIGVESVVTDSVDNIRAADQLILPGVGAFDAGMERINSSGLRDVLDEKVIQGQTPVLGICLGMQLLCTHSEEGDLPGLGWLDAATVRFSISDVEQPKRKIPHMGWNSVSAATDSPLFAGFEADPRFYFVHSFHVVCEQAEDIAGTVTYGTTVTAAVRKNHIFGVQFHPEKSHKYGMNLLRSFAGISKTQQGS